MFLDEVVKSCHINLLQPKSKLPLAYLVSRGVSLNEIKKYNIGYLGNIFSNVKEECEDSKLFNKWLGYKGKFVTNRIVFPIYDELGRIKGIETRGLNREAISVLKPKFKENLKEEINKLPNSSVRYKKFYLQKYKFSAYFFGLPNCLEHVWKERTVFLTEGIFDAISVLKIKPNCVSSLTANINKYQIDWLKRYADRIIVMYDTDKIGLKAFSKLEEELKKEKFLIWSITVKGDDVNDYEIKYGTKDLKFEIEEKLKLKY